MNTKEIKDSMIWNIYLFLFIIVLNQFLEIRVGVGNSMYPVFSNQHIGIYLKPICFKIYYFFFKNSDLIGFNNYMGKLLVDNNAIIAYNVLDQIYNNPGIYSEPGDYDIAHYAYKFQNPDFIITSSQEIFNRYPNFRDKESVNLSEILILPRVRIDNIKSINVLKIRNYWIAYIFDTLIRRKILAILLFIIVEITSYYII
jgi:hypothetical protein